MIADKKLSILIVDDDKFLLNMYSVKFEKEGYAVATVTNTKEAFDKLREGYRPDILILDIVMPDMDGLMFLEMLQKEKLIPTTVVVLLTNQSQESDIQRAKELGAAGYIVKATTIPSEVLREVLEIYEKHKK
ncbi:MAG: twitching motility two-component system response regulator PilG [Parcubacteria group bacterium Gr01-1014_72]|nr:MAG: twitching motility two-component system response regulator PilG [Parcubacteria group bacterium Gr01-1014_72]